MAEQNDMIEQILEALGNFPPGSAVIVSDGGPTNSLVIAVELVCHGYESPEGFPRPPVLRCCREIPAGELETWFQWPKRPHHLEMMGQIMMMLMEPRRNRPAPEPKSSATLTERGRRFLAGLRREMLLEMDSTLQQIKPIGPRARVVTRVNYGSPEASITA